MGEGLVFYLSHVRIIGVIHRLLFFHHGHLRVRVSVKGTTTSRGSLGKSCRKKWSH